jgi:hypothetical protein
MSQFGNGNRGTALTFVAAAAAVLVGSQMVFNVLFSVPTVANADTAMAVSDEHNLLPLQEAVSVSALRPTGQMNAAVSTGQFEELIRPTPHGHARANSSPNSCAETQPVRGWYRLHLRRGRRF